MSRFNTGNPLGSGDPRDLDDNAKNMDLAMNSTDHSWVDRFQRSRLTYAGMQNRFNLAQVSREQRFNDFIASSGYQFAGDYGPGIEITEYNQLIRDSNGEFWRVSGQVELPYTTTGAGIPEDDALVPAGDAVLRQDLANPDKGASEVAYKAPYPFAIGRSVKARLGETVTPYDFGARGDGEADDYDALSWFRDAVLDYGAVGNLGRGIFRSSQTLEITPRGDRIEGAGIHIKGSGSGRGNCWLKFDGEAGLLVTTPAFTLSGFTVSSEDGDGLSLLPYTYPAGEKTWVMRASCEDVRAEQCGRDGIHIADAWVVQFVNCYARHNRRWGMMVRHEDTQFNLGCNALSWAGGEIQGNGTAGSGGVAGIGGGVRLGRSLGVTFGMGATIEGNLGDAFVIRGASNNVSLDTVYFEQNGWSEESVDVRIPATAVAADRPNSVILRNCTHASIQGGQKRAIDVSDVLNFQVHNPTLFGHGVDGYSEPPIRVSESVSGHSTGFVEGGTMTYLGATTSILENNCQRYGKQTTFGLGSGTLANTGTPDVTCYVPLEESDGLFVRAEAAFAGKNFAAGDVRARLAFGAWPSTSTFSGKTETFTFAGDKAAAEIAHSANLVRENVLGGVAVKVLRYADDPLDTYSGDTNVLGLFATIYKGWVK